MPPDLDLDPERLHVHGRRLAAVSDALLPLPVLDADRRAALVATPAGREVLAEVDRSAAAVELAAHELSVLSSWLSTVAATTRTADSDAARTVERLDRPRP
jgi:hypothetical protein